MKILMLYYSGVGNTKMVAGKICERLEKTCDITVVSIEEMTDNFEWIVYDALIIGFPTIHASPAKPIMDYIKTLQSLPKAVPAFIFTSCGLYSANTLRIFAKECVKRNVIPIMGKCYRCSATDGALIAPFMSVWFRHEKKLEEKIAKDSDDFIGLMNTKYEISLPRFKLYSILNYPNKILGQHFLPSIYIHKDHCISCDKCIASCPVSSISKDMEGYPFVQGSTCIHCYRCIHHCPKKALSLSKKRTPRKTLYF